MIKTPAIKLRVKSLKPSNINSIVISSPLTSFRKTIANPKKKGPVTRIEITEPR